MLRSGKFSGYLWSGKLWSAKIHSANILLDYESIDLIFTFSVLWCGVDGFNLLKFDWAWKGLYPIFVNPLKRSLKIWYFIFYRILPKARLFKLKAIFLQCPKTKYEFFKEDCLSITSSFSCCIWPLMLLFEEQWKPF